MKKELLAVFSGFPGGKELSVPLPLGLGYRFDECRCCGVCFFKRCHFAGKGMKKDWKNSHF